MLITLYHHTVWISEEDEGKMVKGKKMKDRQMTVIERKEMKGKETKTKQRKNRETEKQRKRIWRIEEVTARENKIL